MVRREEIIALAKALSLRPDTIEKDYVLGWILWGIYNDDDLASKWFFKGGTSLKKCFFETFRFSEDLDFTVTDPTHLLAEFLHNKFNAITENIYNEIGIEFSSDAFKFDVVEKDQGTLSVQGKIHYRGPLGRKSGYRSIKLDLTTDEIIVLDKQKYEVYHPYTDKPAKGISANCYAFEEVVAEKIRALAQRARPRDLYDVIHFYRNRDMIKNPQLVHKVLVKKCNYKNIPVPTYETIESHEKLEELHVQWSNMLAHQLPILPPIEPFLVELKDFFFWLAGQLKPQCFATPAEIKGEMYQPGRVRDAFSVDGVINKIQYAAENRVCINLEYHDKERTIEPISFRISAKDNKLFYGYERDSASIKCFTIDEIQNVSITDLPYTEREYPIEINASGTAVMPRVGY